MNDLKKYKKLYDKISEQSCFKHNGGKVEDLKQILETGFSSNGDGILSFLDENLNSMFEYLDFVCINSNAGVNIGEITSINRSDGSCIKFAHLYQYQNNSVEIFVNNNVLKQLESFNKKAEIYLH